MAVPCVLIIEDEPMILASLEAALLEGGYQVIACSGAEEAQQQLEQAQVPIAGLVTDIRLKGGDASGWDLAHRAREYFPLISVIYISGDSGADWRSQGVPDSIFIQKPFADAQLVTAISTLLNTVRPATGGGEPTRTPAGSTTRQRRAG